MRQKSMIDLRDPLFLEQQQRQQQQHQMAAAAQQLHLQQQQQQFHPYPGLIRSATEHDIKVRQRRSMATGDPLDDLPPLLRRQMVNILWIVYFTDFALQKDSLNIVRI